MESRRVAEPLGSVATTTVRELHRASGWPPWWLRQQGGSVGRVKLVSTLVAPNASSRCQIYQVRTGRSCIVYFLLIFFLSFYLLFLIKRSGFTYCFDISKLFYCMIFFFINTQINFTLNKKQFGSTIRFITMTKL